MSLFYLNCALLLILYLIFRERKSKLFLVLSLGYFAFLTMFRSYAVGTDSARYVAIFSEISNISNISGLLGYLAQTSTEPGFVVWCKLISFISSDYWAFFAITGLFCYFALAYFIDRYSEFEWLSVFMFFTLGGFDFFLSGMRQSIAVGFLLFAFVAKEKKHYLVSIILCAIAVSFHYSSVLLVLLLFVLKFENTKRFKTTVLIVSVMVFFLFNPFLSLLLKIFPKYNYYSGGELFVSEPNLAVFLKLIVFTLIYCIGVFTRRERSDACLSKEYIQSSTDNCEKLMFIIPFVFLVSFNARALSRLAVSMYPFMYVFFANKVKRMERGNKVMIIFLTIICMLIYAWVLQEFKTPDWQSTYPYSFFWSELQ